MAAELDLVARLLALRDGRARRRASHLRVAIQPHALVLAPLAMAGEDTTIHAVAWGALGGPPSVRSVPDPRQRDDQFLLFEELGAAVERSLLACRAAGTHPQLLVSSAPVAAHLDTLADRLRYSRQNPRVRRFGELLSYFVERAPYAGQQALLTASGALRLHFATGQSDGEDEHLGAFLAWMEPPAGVDIQVAVAEAERQPMGAKTDPAFDRDLLAPRLAAYHAARRGGADARELNRRAALIHESLAPQVLRIYAAAQRAAHLLAAAGLPPLPELESLVRVECEAFEAFMRARDAGRPLALRDGPRVAAFRLAAREGAAAAVEAATRQGDRVGRARARLSGHLVAGVVARPTQRRVSPHRVEYRFDLVSRQRVLRVRPRDELRWADDPRLRVLVTDVHRDGLETTLSLQVVAGQLAVGLPQEGQALELAPSLPDWGWLGRTRAHLKQRLAETPWTHRDGPIPVATPRLGMPRDPLAAVEAMR